MLQHLIDRVALFAGLPRDALAQLVRKGQPSVFAVGSVLIAQGEPSTSMHFIIRGQVQVQRQHPDLIEPVVFATLGPGEAVGEMGLLDGEPRSATVVAVQETETLEVSSPAMADMILNHPDSAMPLLLTLSKRLRTTNDLTAFLAANGRGE